MIHRLLVCGGLALGLFFSSASAQENWPRFRGANGSGVSTSTNPPVKVDGDGAVVWKSAVPPGASSPTIWGDQIFLTAFDSGKLWTLGYDRKTGKELWRVEAPAKQIEKYHHSEGSPASASCATDGKIVVSYFGSCGLFAYDLAGKPIWTYELPTADTAYDFGSGTSPIIADNLVILVRDLKSSAVVLALDLATGKEKWKTDRAGSPTAFSTPIVFGNGQDALLIVPGGMRMKAYDLHSGEEKWMVRGLPTANCTLPVTDAEHVYFAGWSPGGDDFKFPAYDELLGQFDADKDGKLSKSELSKSFMANFFDNNDVDHDGFITRKEWDANIAFMKQGENCVIAINPAGTGDITKSNVLWKHTKSLPYVPSPILASGRLFFVRDGGFASCYEPLTGKPIYEGKRIGTGDAYYASPVAAGDYLYLVSLNKGTLTVLKASADKPEAVCERAFDERVWATPAIVDNQLYVRTATTLYCLKDAGK